MSITHAREALLKIWPSGPQCEHTEARRAFAELDDAETREAELVAALTSMAYQYLPARGGKLHHDCLSAGELLFDVLGWPDDGQPMDPSCLCEVPGCGEGWTCGVNGRDGKYHTFCGKHYAEWNAAGNGETPEQADKRWTEDLRKSGMIDEQITEHKAMLKKQREAWKAGPPAEVATKETKP